MFISEEERSRLNTLGYLRIRRAYSPGEVKELTTLFDDYLAGALHDRELVPGETTVIGPIMNDPRFFDYFDDERVSGIAQDVLGPDCAYVNHGFAAVQAHASPWHSDTVVPQIPALKIAMYLDPVDVDDGCLTVMPGSHHVGFHQALLQAFDVDESLDRNARHPAIDVALDTEPGDVIVFWRPLCHSTWGAQRPRRQLFANFIGCPNEAVIIGDQNNRMVVDETTWKTTYLPMAAAKMPTWQEGYALYGEEFVRTAGTRRRQLMQPLLDAGFGDFGERPAMPPGQPLRTFRAPVSSAHDLFTNASTTSCTPSAART